MEKTRININKRGNLEINEIYEYKYLHNATSVVVKCIEFNIYKGHILGARFLVLMGNSTVYKPGDIWYDGASFFKHYYKI